MRRLFRLILVVAVALAGGLLLYAITPDLRPRFGEDAAALWSWFLIFAAGYVAHRLLPRDDLSHVSRILLAIIASAAAAMVCTWLLILLVDFPVDDGGVGQVLLVGSAAIAFATIVLCPIYFLRNKIGKYLIAAYLTSGVLIPATWVYLSRPFGDYEFLWLSLQAMVLAVIGASASVVFMLVVGRVRIDWRDNRST